MQVFFDLFAFFRKKEGEHLRFSVFGRIE